MRLLDFPVDKKGLLPSAKSVELATAYFEKQVAELLDEAHRLGICHYLSPADRLLERRQEVVAALLSGAPEALVVTKRLIRSFALETLIEQLEAGRKVSAAARASSEAREGLAAFHEKREPNWVQKPE